MHILSLMNPLPQKNLSNDMNYLSIGFPLVVLEATSPSGFKAFMVQARELDGNFPVGIFHIVDPNTRGLPCANMTVCVFVFR